jgi:hypothetical protein
LPISDLTQQLLAALPLGYAPAPSMEFVAIPADAPRWLLSSNGKGLARVLADWSPYRLSSRLKWYAIREAVHLSVLRAFPNVKSVLLGNANEIDWRTLGWSHGTPPTPIVYIGTPGPRRKAVIHLVDSTSGNCDAIVKVPLCPAAKNAIVWEAKTLSTLAEEQYPFSPRLLYLDPAHGVATQQFLPGKSGSRRLCTGYWGLLRSLVLRDEYTTISEQAELWPEQALSASTQKADTEVLDEALGRLSDTHPLPACWHHGDFVPWNIRHCAHRAAALIDWEEAKRGELPLLDVYHFLHMQDFLFAARSKIHNADVEPFAKSLNISSSQCHELETAYLVQAYLQCDSRDERSRADFLLRTLALLLKQQSRRRVLLRLQSQLKLVSSHPANYASIRTELFDAVIAQINLTQLPYCVLSGYDNQPEADASDVDIMFRPQDLHRVPELLSRAAQSAGATLVQSIQHETTACYFVIARQVGRHMDHLAVDCYSDYRRDDRTWMLADNLIANRRQHCDFYLPSAADEFNYYLVKKVLKQDITSHHLQRLQQLIARNPAQCRESISKVWSSATVQLLQWAMVEQDLRWFQGQLPNLLKELRDSPRVERWYRHASHKVRQAALTMRRILFATGFSVFVVGGDNALRSKLADALARNLTPAFRRSERTHSANALWRSIMLPLEVARARIRSTLIIDAANAGSATKMRPEHYDLVLSLQRRDPRSDSAANKRLFRQNLIHLDANSSLDQLLQVASHAILSQLANRVGRRHKLNGGGQNIDDAVQSSGLRSARLN